MYDMETYRPKRVVDLRHKQLKLVLKDGKWDLKPRIQSPHEHVQSKSCKAKA